MFKFKNKNITYVAAAILLLVAFSSLLPAFRTPALDIIKNPLSILTFLRREAMGLIFFHRNLVQNERLSNEVDLLRLKLNAADEASRENERLKNLLTLKQKAPYRVIAARVIARPADSWSSAVIIDKGRQHGLRRGMIAITYLGLAGKLVETTEYTSKIILINDPAIGVSAVIKRSRQEGLVCGTLGSSLIMRYLPKDSDIQISDLVITSGLTESYPKGLLIGKVIEIGNEFSGLSLYAVIKPAIDLTAIEELLVIIP